MVDVTDKFMLIYPLLNWEESYFDINFARKSDIF